MGYLSWMQAICSKCRKPRSDSPIPACTNCGYQPRLTAAGEKYRRIEHPELFICPECKTTVLEGETVCYDDMGQIHHSLCYLQTNSKNTMQGEKHE